MRGQMSSVKSGAEVRKVDEPQSLSGRDGTETFRGAEKTGFVSAFPFHLRRKRIVPFLHCLVSTDVKERAVFQENYCHLHAPKTLLQSWRAFASSCHRSDTEYRKP